VTLEVVGLPLISVVIPLRNEARHIGSCLAGVLGQSYPRERIEIVVVDNGSDDGSYEIACTITEPYPSDQVVRFDGSTIGAVRNFGFRLTHGEIVAFLDADSVPDPDWLTMAQEALSSRPETGCVGYAMKRPDPSLPWFVKDWFEVTDGGRNSGTAVVDWVPSFNLVVRRRLFEEVGGFDEELVAGEDFDFGHRLSERTRVIRSDRTFVDHLGTTDDLASFFRKEYWRGLGTVGLLSLRENRLKVAARLAIPILYVLAVLCGLFAVAMAAAGQLSTALSLTSLLAILGFPLVLALRSRVSGNSRRVRIVLLYSIFLTARGLSALAAMWAALRRRDRG